MKLIVPSVVKTKTTYTPVYEEQTFWQKLFRRPRVVAYSKPTNIPISISKCWIHSDTELILGEKFDYVFGNKLYVGVSPFLCHINSPIREYLCSVDNIQETE